MATRTGKIQYSVTHRGRKHRGTDRNFDTATLAAIINGGEVQEKIKHGDMVGYLGHWPRVKFGLNPAEGGVVDGKAVALEPAIRTVYLKALPDGTIEHETEFLDTATGKMAARMFNAKMGGFSSAIDARRAGEKQIPIGFYGFDFVFEPNYTANRGYAVALDGVMDSSIIFDEVVQEQSAMFDSLNRIFDSLQADFDRQSQAFQRVVEEREELYSMLTKQSTTKPEIVLDSLIDVVHGKRVGHQFDGAEAFLNEKLPGFEKSESEKPVLDDADKHIMRVFGV